MKHAIRFKYLFILLLLNIFNSSFCQEKKYWDIEKPINTYKTINFSTTEGTWMNLDVSPDGKEIVFDLLGDIYKMPISGGQAQLLSGGLAYEVQPRFSPNGKYITYTSDKDGADNIWLMQRNGEGKKQITKENFRLLNNAVWVANTDYIVARKHFTGSRSLGAGELWMYHFAGNFEGVQLTKRKNDEQDLGEPCVSADGKYVYYSEDVSPGPKFEYNKDPNKEIYAIKRINLENGEIDKVAGGSGGAARPQISPDGKYLAFVKRVRLKTVLCIQNLKTGEETILYDDLSKDQQEAWAIFGVYPNFNWLPDSKSIIFYGKGKIRKTNIITQITEEIPFTVDVKQTIVDALHFEQKVYNDEFDVKLIRQITTSPDGKSVIFHAAGYLYAKELPNGKPVRLTTYSDWEYSPSFSPDGKNIIYTTWNDATKGSIVVYNLDTKDTSIITKEKGFYYTPKFSPNGQYIVYTKGSGNQNLGYTFGKNPGIYMLPFKGGHPKLIIKNGANPLFNQAGNRIFYNAYEDGKYNLKSCDINGNDKINHFYSANATQIVPSPDNKWVAFTEFYNVYVTPITPTTYNLEISANNKNLPLKKISKDAGTYMHWGNDSKSIHYLLGGKYFTKSLKTNFNFIEDKEINIDTNTININLKLNSDKPESKTAITNIRIITMLENEVIENGTIIIGNNKILEVGKSEDVTIPESAYIIEGNGKTIIPGLIDVHAHLPTSPDGVSPQQEWSYFANLAYGVTTVFDPSSNTEMVFNQSEMIKAGRLVGPRLYSTGSPLYGADTNFKVTINNLEDALSHLRRLKAVGAFAVKSYSQPRREQRQQIIEAARQLKMQVVPEGGSTFFSNMTMIADGHTSIEHNIPVTPVYKDVINFWNASKTSYTPTLIVSYGAQQGENFWYDRTNVWENEKLMSFTPRYIIDEKSRRRTTSEYGDYGHIHVSKDVNQISKNNTKINLGAHGQVQGLGTHWELWMLAQGGMSNLDVLKAGTINGAIHLGMEKELGTIQKGKLADLIILNSNPLDDIKNTEKIKFTIINGKIYDAETMTEIGKNFKVKKDFWWQNGKSDTKIISEEFLQTNSFTIPECD